MVFIEDKFPEAPGLQTVAVENWERDLPGLSDPSLPARVDRRRAEFRVGRLCAGVALHRLEPHKNFKTIGTRPDRSPDWPAGFVGTITHCQGFAAALVAKQERYLGVGRDTEPLIPKATALEIQSAIVLPGEVELVTRALAIDDRQALSLLFSAKESLYKCVAPRTGIFFDFADARLIGIDSETNTFRLRLLRDLGPEVPQGTCFDGNYCLAADHIHTRCLWTTH